MEEQGAVLIGRHVSIPGSAWEPPEEEPTVGTIVRVTGPTRWYPKGRYEIKAATRREKFLFPVHTFPQEWVLDSFTPTKATASSTLSAPGSVRSRRGSGDAAVSGTPSAAPRSAARRGRPRAATSTVAAQGGDSEGEGTRDMSPGTARKYTGGRSPQRQQPEEAGMAVIPSTGSSPAGRTPERRSPHRTPAQSPARSPARSPSRSPRSRSSPGQRRRTSGKSLLKTPRTAGAGPDTSAKKRSVTWGRNSFKEFWEEARKITQVPRISGLMNLLNFGIMVGVAVPIVLLGLDVLQAPTPALDTPKMSALVSGTIPLSHASQLFSLQWWQALSYHRPLWFVNLVFFIFVDVMFWVIALLQGTTWLIDPYWTFIPALIRTYYLYHQKAAGAGGLRATVAGSLLMLWAARLTHSYFRREEWQFGAREDWRYSDLSRKFPSTWWLLSFLATYLVQHAMLFGITLPLWAVATSTAPWTGLDGLATLVTIAGMCTSWIADNQLRAFMVYNQEATSRGLQPRLLLDDGLWYYCRHPNHFGEQVFWLGLALYAVRLGQPWMIWGTTFNSLCMIPVTRMVEARMLSRPVRAHLYQEYIDTTSCWVPWLKKKGTARKLV